MKKYLVEGFGTFLLALVVGLSLAGHFPVATPLLAGLTLGLFVYTAGGFSGAHINPAVTIGVWSLKKISTYDAICYIVAQFVGAGVALLLVRWFTVPATLVVENSWLVAAAEALGTMVFAFGIAAVVHGKVPTDVTGVTIGGSLLLGLSIAATASNAVLNPAVAFGIGSFNVTYLLAPVVGSLAGMQLYKWLASERSL